MKKRVSHTKHHWNVIGRQQSAYLTYQRIQKRSEERVCEWHSPLQEHWGSRYLTVETQFLKIKQANWFTNSHTRTAQQLTSVRPLDQWPIE